MMTLRTLPRLLLPFAALLLLALPVGGTAIAETPSQAPGQRFEIDPGKLPAPYATDAVANVADLVDRPSPPPFRLPPGIPGIPGIAEPATTQNAVPNANR